MENEGQDILRCDVCDEPEHPFHCDICQVNLCRGCVGDHLLALNKRHQIVPFEERGGLIYSICQIHPLMQCQLYCNGCDVAVCAHCFPLDSHKNHKIVDATSYFQEVKKDIQNDLHEFETIISIKYQDIVNDILSQKDRLNKYSEKLMRDLVKLEEGLHRKMQAFFEKLKSDLVENHNKHSFLLTKEQFETSSKVLEINEAIGELKVLLDSNDVGLVSEYKSKISESRKLPPKFKICFPPISLPNIDFKEIYKKIDLSSAYCLSTEERDCSVENPEVGSSHREQFLTEPIVIHSITTEYRGFFKELHNVVRCDDDEIFMSGNDNKIRVYDLEGKLLQIRK